MPTQSQTLFPIDFLFVNFFAHYSAPLRHGACPTVQTQQSLFYLQVATLQNVEKFRAFHFLFSLHWTEALWVFF